MPDPSRLLGLCGSFPGGGPGGASLSIPQRFFIVSIKLRMKRSVWTAEPAFSEALRLGAASAGGGVRAPGEGARDKTSVQRYLRLNINLLPRRSHPPAGAVAGFAFRYARLFATWYIYKVRETTEV